MANGSNYSTETAARSLVDLDLDRFGRGFDGVRVESVRDTPRGERAEAAERHPDSNTGVPVFQQATDHVSDAEVRREGERGASSAVHTRHLGSVPIDVTTSGRSPECGPNRRASGSGTLLRGDADRFHMAPEPTSGRFARRPGAARSGFGFFTDA